jgi:hypothetical protein
MTMIHEAMVLNTGRFRLIEWAAGPANASLIANVRTMGNCDEFAGRAEHCPATYLVKVSGLAVLIGGIESMFAKLRLPE